MDLWALLTRTIYLNNNINILVLRLFSGRHRSSQYLIISRPYYTGLKSHNISIRPYHTGLISSTYISPYYAGLINSTSGPQFKKKYSKDSTSCPAIKVLVAQKCQNYLKFICVIIPTTINVGSVIIPTSINVGKKKHYC